jgi:hypothetical protein
MSRRKMRMLTLRTKRRKIVRGQKREWGRRIKDVEETETVELMKGGTMTKMKRKKRWKIRTPKRKK